MDACDSGNSVDSSGRYFMLFNEMFFFTLFLPDIWAIAFHQACSLLWILAIRGTLHLFIHLLDNLKKSV